MMGSARRSSTSDIDRAGQILLPGNFYRGAFAAGQEPPPDGTQHVVIINTMDRPPGEHWMCEYRDGPNRLLYDSFGRLPWPVGTMATATSRCGDNRARRRATDYV